MDVLSFLFLALFFSYESHFAFCLLLFPPGLRNTWTAMTPKKCFPQRSTRSWGRCAVRVRRQSALNRPRRRNRRGHQGRKSPPHLRAQTQWVTSNCLTFNPNRISVSWVVFFNVCTIIFMISALCFQEELMQKIREQVLLRRDKVYQDNEGEVRKRWHFEDAVSFFSLFLFHSY